MSSSPKEETEACVVCWKVIRPSHVDVLANGRGGLGHAGCIRGKYLPGEEFADAIGVSVRLLLGKAKGKAEESRGPVLARYEALLSAYRMLRANREGGGATGRIAIDDLLQAAHALYFEVIGLKNKDGFGYLHEDVNAAANRIKDMAKAHLFHDLPLPRRATIAFAALANLQPSAG